MDTVIVSDDFVDEFPNNIIKHNNTERIGKIKKIAVEPENLKYDSRDNCNAVIETITDKLVFGCKNTLISNSVKEIGDNAFSECNQLQTIKIPNSVVRIGSHAFKNCNSLTTIEIPDSVKEIGDSAFSWCEQLQTIEIPNSVVRIGSHAFEYCKVLTIKIPNSVKEIGDYAFFGCMQLQTIEISDSVKEIGNYTFSNCEQLHKLILPRDIKNIKIANSAFWYNHYQAEIAYLGTIDEWIKNNENWEYNFDINCIDGILKKKEVKPVDSNADDDDLPF